jgi:hypothetical protein
MRTTLPAETAGIRQSLIGGVNLNRRDQQSFSRNDGASNFTALPY